MNFFILHWCFAFLFLVCLSYNSTHDVLRSRCSRLVYSRCGFMSVTYALNVIGASANFLFYG
ncbi:hypothetical protein DL93DRAFT_2087214 [Clavulina sp. PMI_390]|nr:hypothetical protein DL93DRAFT_2087214 [Clavulina sp. PMI_390]